MNTIESLFRQFTEIVPASYNFGLLDVLIVLGLSCALGMLIGRAYMATHKGASYSQGYVQTLVILTIVVSGVMLIVGSNIARAFTLVGALSIVRFRNAIKDTRDVGYIFLSMAVGMAVGTRFYPMAVLLAVFVSLIQLLMHRFDFGARSERQSYLRLIWPPDQGDYQSRLFPALREHFSSYSLIQAETAEDGMMALNFAVTHKRRTDETRALARLRELNGNRVVSLIHGDSLVEI